MISESKFTAKIWIWVRIAANLYTIIFEWPFFCRSCMAFVWFLPYRRFESFVIYIMTDLVEQFLGRTSLHKFYFCQINEWGWSIKHFQMTHRFPIGIDNMSFYFEQYHLNWQFFSKVLIWICRLSSIFLKSLLKTH